MQVYTLILFSGGNVYTWKAHFHIMLVVRKQNQSIKEKERETNVSSSNPLLGTQVSRIALSIRKINIRSVLFPFKEPLVSGLSGGLQLALPF